MIKSLFKKVLDRFPKIAQLYRNGRDLLDRNQPSLITPWGFTLAGNSEMASGNFETEQTLLVRKLLEEVDIFVNIGANIGYYCCHALSLGKSVIAVEPITRNLHYLLSNIVKNGWKDQAQVFPVALAAKDNILEIWGGNTGASLVKGWAGTSDSYVTQVPVLTLDRILGSVLDGKRALILVDVEGAEYAVLQGALKTLQHEPRAIWIMEIHSTTNQPNRSLVNQNLIDTFQLFFKNGYKALTANRNKVVVDLEKVQAVASRKDFFTTHNFIFSCKN
jgi:FkbM family methyltransferase